MNGAAMLRPGLARLVRAVVGAGAWVAWREWTRAGAEWPDEGVSPAARSRFMAMLGLLGSLLFAAVILAQWLAKLFLHPCMAI